VLLQTPEFGCCAYADLSDFDSVPSWMLYKLSKKQEETTRSLEKIERGTFHVVQRRKTANISLLCHPIEVGRIRRQTGDLEADGEASFGL